MALAAAETIAGGVFQRPQGPMIGGMTGRLIEYMYALKSPNDDYGA